jgi:hypothetical protein
MSAAVRTADLTAAKGVYFEELEQQAFSREGPTLPNGRKYEERSRDKGGSQ